MKIFLVMLIALIVSGAVAVKFMRSDGVSADYSPPFYSNDVFGYRIDVPNDYSIDDNQKELVLIRKTEGVSLRINAGCYEFGRENLLVSTQTTLINEIPALREDFYDNSKLKLSRISLKRGGECIFIELLADETKDWEELRNITKTFRLTR